MTWNYRLTRRTVCGEEQYSIREVYYHSAPCYEASIGWSDPIDVTGDTAEEVRETLHRMLEACDKPVLDVDTP